MFLKEHYDQNEERQCSLRNIRRTKEGVFLKEQCHMS